MESTDRLLPFGRIALGAGVGLLALRGLTLTTTMPGLPSFWYANQSLWVIIGFALTGAGWYLLYGRLPLPAAGWQPEVSGRRFRSLIVYVGDDCPLCDEAIELLESYQRWLPPPEVIPIKSDTTLSERYCTCVPVVQFDGKVRFRGRVNETLLRRLIEATAALES